MEEFLIDLYFFAIIYPMFFIILPQSFLIGLCQIYDHWKDKKYLRTFFKVALWTYGVSTIITHLYLKIKDVIIFVPRNSIFFHILFGIEALIFMVIPLLPFLVGKKVIKRFNSKNSSKLYYLTTSYFIFGILTVFFFLRNFRLNPEHAYTLTDIQYLPNMINITEVFDILQSPLFHNLLHFIF